MLTDRFVRSAKPGLHSDADGLYLHVTDKGTRSWVFRSQVAGREVKQVLGRYPAVGLAEAREKSHVERFGHADLRAVTKADLQPLGVLA